MELVSVLLIAIGLAMDAFAVSLCKGLALRRPEIRTILITGLWFGAFQGIMPVIGYLLGSSMHDAISDFDHWIAFCLLALIGFNMIKESLSDKEDDMNGDTSIKAMFLLAIATSIDALAVGISLAMEGTDIVVSSSVIAVVTMVISMFGVKIGAKVNGDYGMRAEMLGGGILIAIGLKILAEHLGLF